MDHQEQRLTHRDFQKGTEIANHNLIPAAAAKRAHMKRQIPPRAQSYRRNEPQQSRMIAAMLAMSKYYPSRRDLYLVGTLAYRTGIRTGELRNLCWSDVNLDNAKMTIASKQLRNRTIPLDADTISVLQLLYQEAPEASYVLGARPEIRIWRASNQLRRLRRDHGYAPYNLYDLRIAHAVNLVCSCLPGDVVGRRLGIPESGLSRVLKQHRIFGSE